MIKIKLKFELKDGSFNWELLIALVASIVFVTFSIVCLLYQYKLLRLREFGDESETIVAAKMMASGMKLYSDFFNHHGPLTFLPGLLLETFGNFHVPGHRVAIAVLQLITFFSIYKSPIFVNKEQRIVGTLVSAALVLLLLPDLFGHMYIYQTLAGLFLVIVLSQYTIPAILCPEKLTNFQIILGNFLISSLPFLAVTYLPIASLFFISSLRRNELKVSFVGMALGLCFNILFLGLFGSYAGFAAFHLYLNSKILPFYSGQVVGINLVLTAFITATSDLAHVLSLLILFISTVFIAQKERGVPWRIILIIGGVISLLVRGAGFHGMPFFYALLPFICVIINRFSLRSPSEKMVIIGFCGVILVKMLMVLYGEPRGLRSFPLPKETEFSNLVKAITEKEDRIIAFSFQNYQYVISDRLPASGNYFYLPWQEKYNEAPRFSIKIDTCKQIKEAAPKVMLIDKWRVWNKYTWESYGQCIQKILDTDYEKIPDRPYYIKKGVIRNFKDYFINPKILKAPSSPLSNRNSIPLQFDNSQIHGSSSGQLKGLGILFGTYKRENKGKAMLILKNEKGEEIKIKFKLSPLKDNRYKEFKIPPSVYVAGEVKSVDGHGVSVWESVLDKTQRLSCLKYYYQDGSIGFTPGCPIF